MPTEQVAPGLSLFTHYPRPDIPVDQRPLLPEAIRRRAFSWDRIPRYLAVHKGSPFTGADIRTLATLDVLQTNANNDLNITSAQDVKKANPNLIVLGYRNLIIDHDRFERGLFREHPEWFLKDRETGEYVTMGPTGVCAEKPLFDLRIPAMREWWVNDIRRQCRTPGFDGVLIDALAKVMTNWEPKVQAVGRSDKDVWDYTALVYETLQANMRDNAGEGLIVANAIRSGYEDCLKSYVDAFFHGSYLEWVEQPYPDLYEDHLVRTIDTCIKIGVEGGKFLCFNPHADDPPPPGRGADGCQIPPEKTIMPANVDAVDRTTRSDEEVVARMRGAFEYKLAIYLVCACEYSYFSYASTHCADHDSRLWFPEYPEFDRPLGEPAGPAVKTGPYSYEREFKHVRVTLDLKARRAGIEWG